MANLAGIYRAWNVPTLLPPTHWVGPIREITTIDAGDPAGLQSGAGLTRILARLQNPVFDASYVANTRRFTNLQAFVRDVLEDESARLQIPNDESTILVHSGSDSVMPLRSVGTGVAELIILATICTSFIGTLVCIEEPELHLHPALQRKLVQYLERETDNWYLLSTHSASLLNSEHSSITHVTMTSSGSAVDAVIGSSSLARMVADLGNRASDIVQSNFIVWVEGPSDRIYVAHWLRLADASLLEGVHYSIMFYGGAMLSHLSADDLEISEFIQLLSINRNIAMLIDSDRSDANGTLNATKQRIIKELERSDSMAWVTFGYTVENYVPRDALRGAIGALYAEKKYRVPTSEYVSPLGRTFVGSTSRPGKVAVAREIASSNSDLEAWCFDLREKVLDLADRIRLANGERSARPMDERPSRA